MKDRQMPLDGGEPRIPVLSAALHCAAMTDLVFLRSSFGFVFLQPKSVFFAISWAFVLFAIYAWCEAEVWTAYRAACFFGAAAMLLYWTHLAQAFARELGEKGRHDRYSGTSTALRILRLVGMSTSDRAERAFQLWGEPSVVLLAAFILRIAFHERHLSAWLYVAAGCLWCKEALNSWFELRSRKRQKDIFEDADDTIDPQSGAARETQAPPKATRKPRVKRERRAGDSPDPEA
jgi:hypothetical protein